MSFSLPYEQRVTGHLLAARAEQLADRPFLTIGGRGYTYAETFAHSQAGARGLQSVGVGPPQPVRRRICRRRVCGFPASRGPDRPVPQA